MKRAMRVLVALVLVFSCLGTAMADQTTVGISLNGTSGHHIEPSEVETIPFLPLPMLEIEHVHRNFHIHLEAMPPIGPVSLAQSDGFYHQSQNPRLSYLNGELLYASPIVPLEFGVGETVINQRTTYAGSPVVQASRVVGMRLIGRATLYNDGARSLTANLAVNPGLQGLQTDTLSGPYHGPPVIPEMGEHGSLIDSSLQWKIDEGAYIFNYGLRYLNYTAAYNATNQLADRNHLLMPFVGIDWKAGHRAALVKHPASDVHSATLRPKSSSHWSALGVNVFGTSGNRGGSFLQNVPLNFSLLPSITFDHGFERYLISAEAILPNAGPNPFGATQEVWNVVSVDGLVRLADPRFAVGLGETTTSLLPAHVLPHVLSETRTDAVDFVARMTLTQSAHGSFEARLRLNPDIHVSETYADSFTFDGRTHSFSQNSSYKGARVDASLIRTERMRGFNINYGLRYINQTTDYGGVGPGTELTRSESLMPFLGIAIRE